MSIESRKQEFNFIARNKLTGSFTFADQTTHHFKDGVPYGEKEMKQLLAEVSHAGSYESALLSLQIAEVAKTVPQRGGVHLKI